jgi:hypothetical protein
MLEQTLYQRNGKARIKIVAVIFVYDLQAQDARLCQG